jgi:hypothetical protein
MRESTGKLQLSFSLQYGSLSKFTVQSFLDLEELSIVYAMLTSSVSKIKVEPPGIVAPAPESPYPRCGGILSLRFSPTLRKYKGGICINNKTLVERQFFIDTD